MIRPAVETDIPAIVRMARRFYDTTTYAQMTPMDDDTVGDLARQLMDSVLLVAEQQNQLVGMVGLVIAPFFFNRSILTAHEVVWWVDPGIRGSRTAYALLRALESACRAKGAQAIQMAHLSTSPPQAGGLYQLAGYSHTETAYTKRI